MTEKPKHRRGPALVAQVMEATLGEIARVGIENLSIEEVATRAGVNKTSIWRRWPTPEALALAALATVSDVSAFPDTGRFRTDIAEYVRRFSEVCRVPAMMFVVRIRYRAGLDSDQAPAFVRRLAEAEQEALVIFRRAVVRGELPPGSNVVLLRDMLLAIIYHFVLLRSGSFERDIDQIVALYLDGVTAHP